MATIDIRVRSLDDEGAAFPEVKSIANAQAHGVGIIEGGIVGGKTAVAIIGKLSDGSYVDVLFSEATFKMIFAAFVGAQERFEDLKKERTERRHGVKKCQCPTRSAGKGSGFCFFVMGIKNPALSDKQGNCSCKCHDWQKIAAKG